jgi:3-oxoadipate enol-lactonase
MLIGWRRLDKPEASIGPDANGSMTEASIQKIVVAYDDVGEGAPLLLVHGHPFDRSMWAPQVAAFGRGSARVIAPDLRGYGGTSVVPGRITLDVFAADLAALLDHLAEGVATYAKETLPKMIAARNIEALPDVAKHVLTMMQNAHPEGAAAALRGRAERPAYDDVLAGLRAPAMIVVGDEDAFTTRAEAERMKGLMPHAELVWLEGVGHMPHLERPAHFNAALERLLERAS